MVQDIKAPISQGPDSPRLQRDPSHSRHMTCSASERLAVIRQEYERNTSPRPQTGPSSSKASSGLSV
eukprot:4549516-Amphidinium_carterae.2